MSKIQISTGNDSIGINDAKYDGVIVEDGVSIKVGPACWDADTKVMYFEADQIEGDPTEYRVNQFVSFPANGLVVTVSATNDSRYLTLSRVAV